MAIFIPRLHYNGTDTLDYYTTANIFYGATEWGLNPNTGVYEYLSIWMPNCTAYAYGRFNELDREHSLNYKWPSGNGEDWWTQAPGKGLQRGSVPALGAAMSWTYTDGTPAGHVAVVEEFQYDSLGNITNIITSNSAWNGYRDTPPRTPGDQFPWFYLENISINNLDHWPNQHFQGFIYHPQFPPGSSPLDPAKLITALASGNERMQIKIFRKRRLI